MDHDDCYGWQCSECGWLTFDGDEIRAALWPLGGLVMDLVCPDCGALGSMVDAIRSMADAITAHTLGEDE